MEPPTLTLFESNFSANFWKKAGGDVTPSGKVQISKHFGFWSYWIDPSIWPSFIKIGEMAFITTAWSSHGHALKYSPLDRDRLNTVRSQLRKLKVIFINEISMVKSGMFRFVNLRLQKIMGTRKVLRGVHLIAVGDL